MKTLITTILLLTMHIASTQDTPPPRHTKIVSPQTAKVAKLAGYKRTEYSLAYYYDKGELKYSQDQATYNDYSEILNYKQYDAPTLVVLCKWMADQGMIDRDLWVSENLAYVILREFIHGQLEIVNIRRDSAGYIVADDH